MDEKGLIADAQNGNLDAFNRLVLAYQDILYTQAFRMMGEKNAAEDATQDAFISAYRSIHSYRGGSFRAWLLRIVTNACYDEIRRKKRRPTTPLEPLDDDEEEMESVYWMADPGNNPEEQALNAELNLTIQNCLGRLPLEFRTVIILVDIQGLDYLEAAGSIQKPVGTVKSRLARARIKLQDCLQDFWELLPAQFRLVNEAE